MNEAAIRRALQKRLMTDAGMARFMDKLCGKGNWIYDHEEGIWVTEDPRHSGPGRGFLLVRRGGDWSGATLKEGDPGASALAAWYDFARGLSPANDHPDGS